MIFHSLYIVKSLHYVIFLALWVMTTHLPLTVAVPAGHSKVEVVVNDMSRNMWFPTLCHFDKCKLRLACAASF